MRGAFDRLLTILTPGVIIRRDICKLVANCWHLDCRFHSQFPVPKKKKKKIVIEKKNNQQEVTHLCKGSAPYDSMSKPASVKIGIVP
jgi:hypothetical protein